jgi:hypothetical protein
MEPPPSVETGIRGEEAPASAWPGTGVIHCRIAPITLEGAEHRQLELLAAHLG